MPHSPDVWVGQSFAAAWRWLPCNPLLAYAMSVEDARRAAQDRQRRSPETDLP
jgi:hypothetical protein